MLDEQVVNMTSEFSCIQFVWNHSKAAPIVKGPRDSRQKMQIQADSLKSAVAWKRQPAIESSTVSSLKIGK